MLIVRFKAFALYKICVKQILFQTIFLNSVSVILTEINKFKNLINKQYVCEFKLDNKLTQYLAPCQV